MTRSELNNPENAKLVRQHQSKSGQKQFTGHKRLLKESQSYPQ